MNSSLNFQNGLKYPLFQSSSTLDLGVICSENKFYCTLNSGNNGLRHSLKWTWSPNLDLGATHSENKHS